MNKINKANSCPMNRPILRKEDHTFTKYVEPAAKPIKMVEPNNQEEAPGHNLNIHMYSLDEIIALFDIKNATQISIDDLKRARKKVLMLHPDKSRLGPEYFLFYKKAFDIVVKYYENNNKQNQPVENSEYVPMKTVDFDKSTTGQINKAIKALSTGAFQQKFNDLFEQNMMGERPDPSKNEWFSKEEADFQIDKNISVKNMGEVLETVKQKNQGLVKYRGVENLVLGGNGSNLYDDDSNYVSSDPFSKLKYDDLRRVHKDQTVFSVSESDYERVPKYASIDQFTRERDKPVGLSPLEKQQAEEILARQEREFRERMMIKQHQANTRTNQYEEKNRTILSTFLQIGNR
jgi:hypothetical protein